MKSWTVRKPGCGTRGNLCAAVSASGPVQTSWDCGAERYASRQWVIATGGKGVSDCKFCDAMRINKQCDTISRLDAKSKFEKYGRWMTEYTVAIVKRNWFEKTGKKRAGRTVYYRNKGLGYKLNYCPECGRKLKR